MDNLPLLIKRKHGSILDFAKNVMEMDYRAFNRRLNEKNFRYLEIKKILKALDISFDELKEKEEFGTQSSTVKKTEKIRMIEPEPDIVQGKIKPGGSMRDKIMSLK